MSKLKLNNINFEDTDFVVEVEDIKKDVNDSFDYSYNQEENQTEMESDEIVASEKELILNRAKEEAQNILEEAQKKADEILSSANSELEKRKEEIIENATKRADEIVELAQNSSKEESDKLVESSKEQIEQERIKVTNEGYQDGHNEGVTKAYEELEEKMSNFSKFIDTQYNVRDKILKSVNKDILDLILNITKKILLEELDAKKLDKIIKNAISLLEKKENINIILSEKYARLLYEFQKKSLDDDIEFNFEDFKQYDNFDIIYNQDFDDDTIIVENIKERYDASINSQLDVIIRNIYDNTQNGKINLEQYENEID